jgi:hypothetical protein
MSAATAPTYPVRVEGRLDPELSRWLWLVKWLLVIPHYIVLGFLWIAFVVLSIVAGVAILFTGRYPRGVFDFNVGVLRWTWRVGFYAFGANGTDRYPPFALGETDYPATLEIEYPERLSRGLVLVKWWLLAIPHYVVVALFLGGGTWAVWQAGDDAAQYGGGLVGVLVFIAVVALLFTGRYPRGIFDLVLGMDRWALRVAAYAGLMTDRYPPFRLDLGGADPAALTVRPEDEAPPAGPARSSAGWSAGRTIAVILAAPVALLAAALLAAGVAGVVIDQVGRNDQGFVMSTTEAHSTGTYALVSETVTTDVGGLNWSGALDDLVGDVEVRAGGDQPLFVGIGSAGDIDAYLRGSSFEQLGDLTESSGTVVTGGTRPAPPQAQDFWVAQSSGTGEQTLQWDVADGDWRAVVMTPDAAPGVSADVAVGAELPGLLPLSLALLGGGALLLAASGMALALAVRGNPRGAR